MNDKKLAEKKIIEGIKDLDCFLVTSHLRADGDAIASMIFIIQILTKLNKKYWALLHDTQPDPRYKFLSGFEQIQSVQTPPPDLDPKAIIMLDSPTPERCGDVAHFMPADVPLILIDHHISNSSEDPLILIDQTASSTCEILVRLSHYIPDMIDFAAAEALYTGICFDTGRFRFSNTTSDAMEAAAEMLKYGVDPEKITEVLFYNWSHLRTTLMASVLNSIQYFRNSRIAVYCLPFSYFRDHPEGWRELEGFSDLGIAIAGVEISLFLKELSSGQFKISLRAKGRMDVGRAAERFGGGGHSKAAGCEIQGTEKEVIAKLLEAVEFNFTRND